MKEQFIDKEEFDKAMGADRIEESKKIFEKELRQYQRIERIKAMAKTAGAIALVSACGILAGVLIGMVITGFYRGMP